jgi:hypothetical protein
MPAAVARWMVRVERPQRRPTELRGVKIAPPKTQRSVATESAPPNYDVTRAPWGAVALWARGYCLMSPVPPSTVRTLPTNSRRLASTTGQRRCSHAPPF